MPRSNGWQMSCSTRVNRGSLLQAGQVGSASGSEIVHAHHMVALGKKGVAQMRAEEAGGAGDQDTMSRQNTVSPVLESICDKC